MVLKKELLLSLLRAFAHTLPPKKMAETKPGHDALL
jgi:hypothetical protein